MRSGGLVRLGRGASRRIFADRLPQAIQVNRTQRAVIQSRSRLAGFAPDHAAVVGAHITLKTDIVSRP